MAMKIVDLPILMVMFHRFSIFTSGYMRRMTIKISMIQRSKIPFVKWPKGHWYTMIYQSTVFFDIPIIYTIDLDVSGLIYHITSTSKWWMVNDIHRWIPNWIFPHLEIHIDTKSVNFWWNPATTAIFGGQFHQLRSWGIPTISKRRWKRSRSFLRSASLRRRSRRGFEKRNVPNKYILYMIYMWLSIVYLAILRYYTHMYMNIYIYIYL